LLFNQFIEALPGVLYGGVTVRRLEIGTRHGAYEPLQLVDGLAPRQECVEQLHFLVDLAVSLA
jgi:hypothetical protein